MKFRSVWALAVAGACGVALPGHAAEVLRLEDAVARALGTHPSVQADAAQIEATKNRAAREGLAAPLVLGGELENVAGSGSVRGMDAAGENDARAGPAVARLHLVDDRDGAGAAWPSGKDRGGPPSAWRRGGRCSPARG